MTHDLGALALLLMIAMVLTRVATLQRRGIEAMKFGAIHRQTLREEAFLRERYGEAYSAYSARVRRYL